MSAKERLVSLGGGGVAIAVLLLVTEHAMGLHGAAMLVASMGASAVLLFAVPHGQLSQPWPVLGGHVVSAAIGVACAQQIGNRDVAAAAAVGLAIVAMHLLRCIHPPGGATALTAVMAGPAVADLGWSFVLRPVLLNAAIMLVMAIVVNAPFAWRRYPALWARRPSPPTVGWSPSHEDVVAALREIDSFVDVTEDDLVRLVALLQRPRPVHGRSDTSV